MNKQKASGLFIFIAGLLTMVLGLFLVVFPAEKYSANIHVMSLGFIVIGFFYIMTFVANKKLQFRPGWTLQQGFYMIIIGVLCLFSYDNELSDSMNLLFAMWALSCATAQIAASVQIRSLEYTKWWRILICGIVNILCFVYFIIDPLADFITLYISFGAYLIISSVICFSELFNYNTTLN